jgi:PHD-finger/PHD-zinc-finger like domain
MKAAGSRMRSIMRCGIREKVSEQSIAKEEWAAIESLYLKQRTWRKVASTAARGMRDHSSDFNKMVHDTVPASWVIRVDGRPPLQDQVVEEEDKEVQEDSVCMCCFDGSSLEGNRIMFCDGCNAAVHQACYGVSEIPEGDFFCDRCRAVQVMADEDQENEGEHFFDPEYARDAVKCCLCPIYHGGFKPTTDGRWVHLCCAIWSGNSSILDLSEMSPVDVSGVCFQSYREARDTFEDDRRRGRSQEVLSNGSSSSSHSQNRRLIERIQGNNSGDDSISECCMFCGAYGGYVVRCAGRSSSCSSRSPSRSPCKAVFHPLCAWFQGLSVSTTVTDPTFQV